MAGPLFADAEIQKFIPPAAGRLFIDAIFQETYEQFIVRYAVPHDHAGTHHGDSRRAGWFVQCESLSVAHTELIDGR